jgi:hypothetical protein
MPRRTTALTSHSASSILLAAGLLLLAFALRAHRLAYDSIWWDEGFSIWMGRMPIAQMMLQTAHDAHPPLSYAMLHGWIGLVGNEEFALRMQSVLLGVLTTAAAYQIGRIAGGRQAALAGALLTAVMRLPVWWSQEVRMYAPAAMFAGFALWAALHLFTSRHREWRWALVLAVSLGAGLMTLYLFVGVVLALNLAFLYAFLIRADRWRLAVRWVAAQAGALAIFVPWVVFAYQYLPSWAAPEAPVTLLYVAKLYLSAVFLGIATDLDRYLLLLIAALIVLIGSAAVAWIASHRRTRVVWVTLVIGVLLPPILVYLLSIPRGQFNYPTPSPRYFLLLSTPVYVLIGWGATSLQRLSSRGWIRFVSLTILAWSVAVAGWSLSIYYPGLHLVDDYQSIAATLEAFRQPRDSVVLNNDTDWPIFDYHYQGEYGHDISQTQRVADEKYARGLLRPYQKGHDGLWLVQTRYADVTDPDNYLWQWAREHAWGKRHYSFPEGDLWFFAFNADRALPPAMDTVQAWPEIFQPVEDAPIADGVRLIGFTQPVPQVYSGDLLVVGLGWHVDAGMRGSWPVALKGIASDGTELFSQSVQLEDTGEGDRFLPVKVFVPPGLPEQEAQIVFAAGTTWQPLQTVHIRARPGQPLEQAIIPPDAQQAMIRFGDSITLAAIDLPAQTTWKPGEGLPITLYWQTAGVIPDRYKAFIHVIGTAYDPSDNSNIWGQQDQEPRNAERPTTSWRPGETIADDYLIPIQADTPPGRYTIQLGLYLPLEGQRLPAFALDGTPLRDSIIIWEIDIAP